MVPRSTEEPTVPNESAVSREEVPAIEHLEPDEQPTVADQSQTIEPRVEEQTSPGELEVHAT